MEEKERLAREQEIQQRFKSQPSLQPMSTSTTTAKVATRDLSSTLLSGDLMTRQIPRSTSANILSNTSSSVMGGGTTSWGNAGFISTAGSGSNIDTMAGSRSNFGTTLGSMHNFGAAAQMPMSSQLSTTTYSPSLVNSTAPPRPAVDMSSLDSILPMKQQRVPMNRMMQPSTGISATNFGPGNPFGVMQGIATGNPSPFGQPGTISNLRFGGNGGTGLQSFPSPMGSVGVGTVPGQLSMTMMQPRAMFGQTTPNSSQPNNAAPLSNKDITDFLS